MQQNDPRFKSISVTVTMKEAVCLRYTAYFILPALIKRDTAVEKPCWERYYNHFQTLLPVICVKWRTSWHQLCNRLFPASGLYRSLSGQQHFSLGLATKVRKKVLRRGRRGEGWMILPLGLDLIRALRYFGKCKDWKMNFWWVSSLCFWKGLKLYYQLHAEKMLSYCKMRHYKCHYKLCCFSQVGSVLGLCHPTLTHYNKTVLHLFWLFTLFLKIQLHLMGLKVITGM